MTTTTASSRATSLPKPAAARRPRVPPRELVQSPSRARADPQAECPRRPRPPPRRPAAASSSHATAPSSKRRDTLARRDDGVGRSNDTNGLSTTKCKINRGVLMPEAGRGDALNGGSRVLRIVEHAAQSRFERGNGSFSRLRGSLGIILIPN